MYPDVPYTKMAENLEFVKMGCEFLNESVLVIKDSFGPNGLDTLISTSSGSLLMTNDGYPVLKSLSSHSPVGKLIFQCVDMFYKTTGDFSKKFILLIREMLGEILEVVSKDGATSRRHIVQGLLELLQNLSKLFDKLQAMGVVSEYTGDIDGMQDSAISIIETSISGKFSPKTCKVLVALVKELVCDGKAENDVRCLKETTVKLLDRFSTIVWEVPGKPLSSSAVFPGFIIPREFLTIVKKLPCTSERDSFKFVILGTSLGYDLPQSTSVLSLHDSQQVNDMLEWRGKYIENVIRKLAAYEVELVITPATLHETFVHICNQYGMAAIHLIPQEDIARISEELCIHPLFEIDDDLTSFICTAASCKSIQVGQHGYVYLEPTKILIKQVLLNAPTQSLCHQYSIALQNMLRVLQSSFKENPDKSQVFSYVQGGGTFELCLAFMLEEYRKLHVVNPNTKLAFQIVEKALLSIPRQLAANSNCRLSIFNLTAETRLRLTCRKSLFGLSKGGELRALRVEGIVEPTMANCSLVASVLQLFVQILKTDKIVHVKTLPSKNVSKGDDDSDSEVDV